MANGLSISFTVDANRFPHLRAAAQAAVKTGIRNATISARNHSIPFTPVKTNQLRMRVSVMFSDGGKTGEVKWLMPYAVFHELGTRRIIRPVRAKFLVFKGKNGKLVFAKQVRGVTARHFARKGAEAAIPFFKADMEAAYRL
jgi:hypothetical protein